MVSLTRKTDYALVAVATLAEHEASRHMPLSAADVSGRYGLPRQVMVQVLKDLQRAGLVGSARGAHGGYYLQRNPAWISLADVVEAIEGHTQLTPCCCDNDEEACVGCSVVPICPISERVRQLNGRINAFFQQVTLKDLMAPDFQVARADVTVESRKRRGRESRTAGPRNTTGDDATHKVQTT